MPAFNFEREANERLNALPSAGCPEYLGMFESHNSFATASPTVLSILWAHGRECVMCYNVRGIEMARINGARRDRRSRMTFEQPMRQHVDEHVSLWQSAMRTATTTQDALRRDYGEPEPPIGVVPHNATVQWLPATPPRIYTSDHTYGFLAPGSDE